jgi:hypothetical protein
MYKFFVIFFIFISYSLQGTNVSTILQEIPDKDRQEICSLFSFLVKEDHFAYTLFGDKAVSISGHFTLTPWENTLERIQSDAIFWKKWQTWEKYKNLFTFKNYLVLNENHPSKNLQVSHIIIINKKAFLKTVYQHLPLFESILGHKIVPEQLLSNIESGKASFRNSISNNEMLWGILLGYGKHNAILYNRRERDYFNNAVLSSPALEYSTIKLKGCGDYGYYPFLIGSVYFVGDLDHAETVALRQKYRKLRGEISAIYAKGDFLEITLSKLTE